MWTKGDIIIEVQQRKALGSLGESKALRELAREQGNALGCGGRKAGLGWRIVVLEDNPDAWAINLIIARTNRAGELSDLEAGSTEDIGEDASRIIHEIAETLRNEDGIHIAGCGLVESEEIVIRQRRLEGDLDGGGGLVLVGNDAQGHGR